MTKHIPVLLDEVINGLAIKENGVYVDLTLGRAGHASVILSKLNKDGLLIGIDQDEAAIKEGSDCLTKMGSNYKIVRDNFSNFGKILDSINIDRVDGILMDLGVSSPQFDNAERGFSYKTDGPLDMRMDQRQTRTAYSIVNSYSLEELNKIFREYGDEKYSYSIAKNIVKAREVEPISSTLQLVEIIKKSKPIKELNKIGHPAKQAFQALRIATNDELNVLESTLKEAMNRLKSGGRLAVITFHSGEDRIVKKAFRDATIQVGNRINGPTNEKEILFTLVNKKPIIPSEKEMEENHRSKSAKLRIIEAK